MASAAASGNGGAFTLTSLLKGEAANLIGFKVIADPAGATGATTVSVSGNNITVKLKNDGVSITATKAEIYSALSGSTHTQKLCAVGTGSATGANTGAAVTGSYPNGFVRLAGGAEGSGTVLFDNLAAATGPLNEGLGVKMSQGAGLIDTIEYLRPDGKRGRVSTVAATGATAAVLAFGRTKDRLARKGENLGSVGV